MSQDVAHPVVNDRVWLSLNSSLEQMYSSRIEAARDQYVAVSAPLMYIEGQYTDEPELVEVGTPSEATRPTLVWRLENGYFSSKTKLIDITEAHDLSVWHLEYVTDPELVQRRQFVRVPVNIRANVHLKNKSVEAHVVDLSEGGLRCVSHDLKSKPNEPTIHMDVIIDGHMLMLSGTLARFSREPNGMGCIALEFNPMRDEDATILRRHIFGRQVKLRKFAS